MWCGSTRVLAEAMLNVARQINKQNLFARSIGGVKYRIARALAEAVAKTAGGGAEPLPHKRHKSLTGYYLHFHIHGHPNGGHVFYLY